MMAMTTNSSIKVNPLERLTQHVRSAAGTCLVALEWHPDLRGALLMGITNSIAILLGVMWHEVATSFFRAKGASS